MAQYKDESNMFHPDYNPGERGYDMVGQRITEDTYTEGHTGFASYGKPVPSYRRVEADKHLKQMCGSAVSTEERSLCIGRMVNAIERDQPEVAFHAAMQIIDLTGTYRLLAVLLCHEDEPEAPTPPSYLDLVQE